MATKSMQINVVGGFNQQRSSSFDYQQSINWYPMTDEVVKKSYMVPTSGTQSTYTFIDAGLSAVGRASFTIRNLEYHVVGNTVFTRNTSGIVENIGTIGTSTGYVGISSNGLQVLFVDGSQGYIYTIDTGTFVEIDRTPPVDPNDPSAVGFPLNPIDCCFIKGFFFVIEGETNRFFQSAPDDCQIWDPSNFAMANSNGDILVCCRSLDNRLWLFSTESISIWEDEGKAGFAFRQDQTVFYDYGAYSAKSTVVDQGVMIFQARTTAGVGSTFLTTGGRPQEVSSSAVNFFFSNKDAQGGLSDLEAFIFKENGQIFWQCSSTISNFTIVYNSTNSSWFTRQMLDGSRHIATSYVFFNGEAHILSYNDNLLYIMSQYVLTDEGLPIYRARRPSNVYFQNYARIRMDLLQANFESGVGINGNPNFNSPAYVQGSDPQAFLSISRDGGTVFGNSRPAPMGRIGEFDRRTIWRKLGISGKKGQVAFFIEIFDSVRTYLIDASLSYEVQ